MSKPRVALEAIVDTENHANTIISNVSSQLVGKDIFQNHRLTKFIEINGTVNVFFDCRFNNNVDRDAIKDWVRDQIENHPQVKTWVSLAKVSWHRCTHNNQNFESCLLTNYFEWSKP